MDLSDIFIYRMTHIENIKHILKYGITGRNSPIKNPNYKNIGDTSLIETRKSKEVKVGLMVDYLINPRTIILGDFIPFYFGKKMPMLFVSQKGGNFTEKVTIPNNIIYLKCSLKKLISLKNEYYFSDGHPTDNFTTFYDSSKINELPNIIDWKSINKKYWGGNENSELKRKKQAEFLIKGDLPLDVISEYGCYDDKSKEFLVELGISPNTIKVVPNAYY